jgi:predicted phage-related endonuclease
MNRTTHDVHQGTGPWLRLREGFFTASEAPAALGVSKYTTRAELLRRKHTGVAQEYDPATLAKFRAGHDAEAGARPLAEQVVGGELFPVTMSVEIDGLQLLASLDGMTMDDVLVWETKLWNDELATDVRAGTLSAHYTVQMDQELLVSGASRCLFTCTDGTPERFVSCWYEADQAKFDALIAGWKQFAADLAAYVLPASEEPAPVGKAPDTLPALRIEVTGQVTASNLAEFKQTALAAIQSVNRSLSTDQDFANAEKAVKWCADVEDRLKAAKEHALSQTSSIDALFKAIDDISAEARRVRLDLDKLVTRRKTEVKEEAVDRARKALDMHIAVIHAEIAPMRLQTVTADFGGAIKGKRSVASMQDALDTTLSGAKIAADTEARAIRKNVDHFKEVATGLESLFPDLGALVHKAPDDFRMLVQARIIAQQERDRRAEEARQAAETQRIAAAEQRAREQEAARIEREQAVKAEAQRETEGEKGIDLRAVPLYTPPGANSSPAAPAPSVGMVRPGVPVARVSANASLLERLDTAPPSVLLQREAAAAIRALESALAQARRDLIDEQRSAATEARWQERNEQDGVPYGTY